MRVRCGIVPHNVCKWLITSFFCSGCPCTALWTKRKIEVFENIGFGALFNLFAKFFGKCPSLSDCLQNAFLTLFHRIKTLCKMLDLSDFHFIQRTCTLFSVSRNKRNCRPLRKEFDGVFDLPDFHTEFFGYLFQIYFFHITVYQLCSVSFSTIRYNSESSIREKPLSIECDRQRISSISRRIRHIFYLL